MQLIRKLTTILDLDRRTYEAGTGADPDLTAIADTAGRLDSFQKRAADVAQRRAGNSMETPQSNARALSKWLDGELATVSRDFDQHRIKTMQRLADLRRGIEEPLKQAGERGLLAGEYRAVFRSLDDGARSKFLREAADAGDIPALGSILGASAVLSGISRADWEQRRREYLRIAHGETMQRIERAEAAQARLDKAASLLVDRVNGLVDRQALGQAEAAEAALRKAEAAV